MEDLAKIMGGAGKLKLLRLFYFNADMAFTLSECATRARITLAEAKKEVQTLMLSKAIKKRTAGKGSFVYSVNTKFVHYDALAAFLIDTTEVKDAVIIDRFKKAGTLRLIALSGLFTGAQEPQIDVLVVGDQLSEKVVGNVIHTLESELGRELRYAAFATEDFRYRLGVYDRLLRDMFDYNHRIILDKIGMKR
jgi:hypothetical protein